MRAAQSAKVKVKSEFKREKRARESSAAPGNEDGDDGDVTVTAYMDRRKRARAGMEGAETIDLTGD